MELFPLFSAVLVVAALFSYLNHRFFGLPTTIGVMLIALVFSLLLVLLDAIGLSLLQQEEEFLPVLKVAAGQFTLDERVAPDLGVLQGVGQGGVSPAKVIDPDGGIDKHQGWPRSRLA